MYVRSDKTFNKDDENGTSLKEIINDNVKSIKMVIFPTLLLTYGNAVSVIGCGFIR